MKSRALFLTFALIAVAAVAAEDSRGSASPQPRPRLDPAFRVASDARSSPGAGSPALAMSPYIVRGSTDRSQTSQLVPIPQGTPALSGSRLENALQSGILLEHVGKKSTALLLRGEPGAGGFGVLTVGYSRSW